MMKSGPRIATAVAIGYILGRTRRMKLAITVGSVLAGRKLGADPKELLQKAGKLASASPELSQLSDTVRGQLLEAARTAATAAASNKIDALGESLTERAAKVRAPASARGSTETDEADAADAADAETEQEEPRSSSAAESDPERGDRGKGEGAAPQRRSTARRQSASTRENASDRSRSDEQGAVTRRTPRTPSSPRTRSGQTRSSGTTSRSRGNTPPRPKRGEGHG